MQVLAEKCSLEFHNKYIYFASDMIKIQKDGTASWLGFEFHFMNLR